MCGEFEPIIWKVTQFEGMTFIEFTLSHDLIHPESLKIISLPDGLNVRRHLGLIISGRGPVWLFGYLIHLAHPFAWVATYDPRLKGGVVVMNHVVDGPDVGEIITLDVQAT